MPELSNGNRLSTLLLTLLSGVAGATAAGFAARAWWGFELFSHFRVQYAAAAALLALGCLLARRMRAALAALALVAINGTTLAPLYLAQAHAASVPAQRPLKELRVLSLNVYADNPGIERIIRYLQRENPDVIVLLEITDNWTQPLQQLSGRYPFHWIRPGNKRTGIAVLSRAVPEQTRVIDLGNGGVVSLLMTLAGPADTRLSILGTHLSAPMSAAAADIRNRQLAVLAQVARAHPWPLLLVGDLNITPFSPWFGKFRRDGGLRNCSGSGWHPTWPTGVAPMLIQIDHCLAAGALAVRDFRVGSAVGSDHYPIMMKAGFAKP